MSAFGLWSGLDTTRERPLIAGNTLRTDTGNLIRACGGMHILATAPNATSPAIWDLIRSKGLNTARVDVKTLAIGRTVLQQLDMIDTAVDLARTRRCYVMLMNSTAPNTFWVPSDPNNRTNANSNQAFWEVCAARYASEPHVFYELTNEPAASPSGPYGNDVSWITPAPANTPKNSLIWVRQIYDIIRAAAPQTMIAVTSTANLAPNANRYRTVVQQFEALGSPIDWTKTVFSYHHYDGTMNFGVAAATSADDGMDGIAAFRAWYPLLLTETSYWVEAFRNTPQYQNILTKYERDQLSWTSLSSPTQPYIDDIIGRMNAAGYTLPKE